VKRTDRKTGKKASAFLAPVWTGHADFCNPFEFATFMRTCRDFEFDVMLRARRRTSR
jgi:UV DNA damage endonuclease